jgi:uncharacterized membrane protein
MESKAKLAGHPVHPMLIVFPLGLLSTAVVFDVIALLSGNGDFATAAFWAIVAGVVGGLAAAVFGTIDWLAIPKGTRAHGVGFWHGAGNTAVMALFLVSLIIRWSAGGYWAPAGIVVMELAALGLALVTGWLGGELVDRLGVGVDPGAHLDAPSSLSGKPARQDPTPSSRAT